MLESFSPQLQLIVWALRYAGGEVGVVDLGSGSGRPWRHLSPQINRLAGRRAPITLTDKYPDPDTAAQLPQPTDVIHHPPPVDARAIVAPLMILHAGSYRHRGAPVTFLIGYPRERTGAAR